MQSALKSLKTPSALFLFMDRREQEYFLDIDYRSALHALCGFRIAKEANEPGARIRIPTLPEDAEETEEEDQTEQCS